ncbi:hypothetical protein GCM10009827_115200 [Dactylosporangium maewongense]|uniref:Uncharacterized protein n=1 Tax=Dactylosporangium maewongense TaxID=634393 RepID=A0ABN2DFJ5_9ACTN
MLIKVIRGHECTDRAGVAELLERSLQTVKYLAADRPVTGFPEPFEVDVTGRGSRTTADGARTGREYYRIADILAFKPGYLARVAAATLPRSHGRTLDTDPDTMLDPAAFAAYLRISPDTFGSYVAKSKDFWHAYAIVTRHATTEADRLTIHATVNGESLLIADGDDTFSVDADIHKVFGYYDGTWQPELPGYTFPGDARAALSTLLTGEDFYLPPPDEQHPGRGGMHRRWRGATAQSFNDQRHGSADWPRRRRRARRAHPSA